MIEPVTPRRALIIGYGNPLRQDDGAGYQVAQHLLDDPEAIDTDVLARTQLTPELAVDLHHATVAVLVDASVSIAPGRWHVSPVAPAAPSRASSHSCTPQTLVALATDLYGRVAPTFLIAIGVTHTEASEHLTAEIAEIVPSVATAALSLARSTGMPWPAPPVQRDRQ